METACIKCLESKAERRITYSETQVKLTTQQNQKCRANDVVDTQMFHEILRCWGGTEYRASHCREEGAEETAFEYCEIQPPWMDDLELSRRQRCGTQLSLILQPAGSLRG